MRHDFVIRGAEVIDGSGKPAIRAEVHVRGAQISAIRPAGTIERAHEIIDAHGLTLTPGFIDVHTHDDLALIHTPEMLAKTSQGVTTVITGLCGYSAAPLPQNIRLPEEYDILIPGSGRTYEGFADYIAAVEAARPAVNSLALVGHSTLRIACMDDLSRPATADEMEQMCRLLDQALDEGAAGLSSGLAYSMASNASTEELVALCRRLTSRQAPYVTHVRDEGNGLVDAVAEALDIGKRANVPVIFSHHKALGSQNHGKVAHTLKMIDAACDCQKVGLDVYPYVYSSTSLTTERAARGGKIIVTRSVTKPDAVGRTLEAVAHELGCDTVEAVRRLQPAGALFYLMAEDDVHLVLSHPLAMIGSDGLPFDPMPHPRLWGTFPRVLGHYARDMGLMTVEAAVHKMTGLPAQVFGLKGRGLIEEGAFADLALIDLLNLSDRASPTNPVSTSRGITRVWVNGQVADIGAGRQIR